MNWCLSFVVFLTSFLIPSLILLLGSMDLFSLFLRRVIAPTPPIITLLLSLWLLLRFSKLCLTPTSSNISNLTIFSKITSMAFVRQDLQVICFPILLIPSQPLLGTLENHSSSLSISLKHLTEPYAAKFPAYGFIPPFCKLISSFLSNRITEWGTRNLVKFNISKTQLLIISLSNTPSNYPIIFEDRDILPLDSFNILGFQISSSLSWRDHIVQIAKSASKKIGGSLTCKQHFSSA